MHPNNWLVSSGGRRGALVELLHDAGARVVVTDASAFSAAGRLADEFEVVPRIDSAHFIQETLRIGMKHGSEVIIPTIDPEIAVYSSSTELFRRRGIDVWVSSPEVAELGWDKWKMFQWMVSNGFPTIDTQEIIQARRSSFDGKIVAKPRSGSSSVGVILAKDSFDLDFDLLTNDYIIQRFAPGIEVTVDIAVDERGRVLATIPRRRLEVRAGEVSKGVTIHVPEIESLVRDVVTALPGAYGVLNVQVIFDPVSRSVQILEINPRFGGGYPLSHASGGDLIGAMCRSRTDNTSSVEWRPGTVMLRYDDAAFYLDPQFALNPWK
ncbi:ATP-grasp domain-containing protein [Cryobacterium sp. TMT1-3]|uniref:ATP-grasp domain-containing protein n=1 Tax=Cryobacterium sp. TMT1-3 TaxID=1259237 RepID=UPI00141A84F5|nr:ATP-grasp domain-containing protein [Cryobacterium sp. TMT1-3]